MQFECLILSITFIAVASSSFMIVISTMFFVTSTYSIFGNFIFIVKPSISNPIPMNNAPQSNPTVNLINNFNNNYRSQTSGFPHCVALYDFEAENPGELSFKVSFVKLRNEFLYY